MMKPLEKKGSIIGDYMLDNRPGSSQHLRQVSFVGHLMKSSPDVIAEAAQTLSDKTHYQVDSYSKMVGVSCPQRVFKVVFIGSSGVGKSSFIHQYCRGHFPNNMSTTVGMDFQVRSLVLDSTQIALQLWDTAGQERFHSITTQYYRKADGILVMYDVTQITSFTAVRGWLNQVQKNNADGACLMLLGNKMDMNMNENAGERQVTTMQGQKLAEDYQVEFFECSAKSGHNIHEAMTHLARLMGAQQDKQCESVLQSLDNSSHRGQCCT